ncbi:MAG: VWA domain-containing protein [Pyrinomonadaceae bacterium]|nr:VWA domain-containing protein [Pyrinomonadaceae bacterium]
MIKHYNSYRFAVLLVFAFLFSSVQGVLAQDDEIKVNTEVVNVSVSVFDRKGNAVVGLTREDFELLDNGKKTPIEFFSSVDAPVSYGIVYDLHPSTTEQTKSVLRSLDAFTKSLGKNEDFFLTVFNEYGSLNINFVPNEEQIRRHLSYGERNEPNSLYDAVFFAGEKLKSRNNQKRTLIIISDGKDHQSHHSLSELERLVESFSVQIYAVILDTRDKWNYDELSMENGRRLPIDESELDKAAIKALSASSGGSASSSPAKNTIDLYKIFDRISVDTRQRYSIGFYPSEGESHKLKINLRSRKKKGTKLHYRKDFKIAPKP